MVNKKILIRTISGDTFTGICTVDNPIALTLSGCKHYVGLSGISPLKLSNGIPGGICYQSYETKNTVYIPVKDISIIVEIHEEL